MWNGQRLKKARLEAKYDQLKLAEMVGVHPLTISRYESGQREPRAQEIELIAKALNISVAYLFGESDDFSRTDDLKLFDNQVIIPIYRNITPHCGEGTDNGAIEGELEQYLPLPADYVGTKEASQLYGLYVDGNSMEAARIADGNIAIIRKCDDWFSPGYGDPCYVQYERDGFMVDAIKFYYPKRDGSSVTLRSAEGSGVRELTFDHDDIICGNPNILGVVIGVVEFHKPVRGR